MKKLLEATVATFTNAGVLGAEIICQPVVTGLSSCQSLQPCSSTDCGEGHAVNRYQ